MITDLTEGSINKKLWLFSIPMLVSVMFQQIYNIADSMIAGKFIGEAALSAVGASYPITMLFMAVAIGANTGCSVVVSQLFGAKDLNRLKTAISTTFIASFFVCVILTIVGLLRCEWLMNLVDTPEDIFADAKVYLTIYIWGVTFVFLYNVCTGLFNALGDSRTPLIFLIGSSIGNILLDLLFVIVFRMGVAGVAWATFIAQGISCILSLITLWVKVRKIKIPNRPALFSAKMLGKISLMAVPSILQQSFVSIGNMFIQNLVNGYGSSVIAGYSAAIKLNTFAITSYTTLSNGLSSFTAQNIGAGKLDRVKKGFRSGIILSVMVVVPIFLLYFFCGRSLITLFMDAGSSTKAIDTGISFLKIASPFYIVIMVKLMADGVLKGSGAMRWFMISTLIDLFLRVIIAFVLSPRYGSMGIWMSWPIGWTVAMILSLSFYLMGVWKRKSL